MKDAPVVFRRDFQTDREPKPLQNLAPRWERWLTAGESLKKRTTRRQDAGAPGKFAEVSNHQKV
jgi:hypothetical protein